MAPGPGMAAMQHRPPPLPCTALLQGASVARGPAPLGQPATLAPWHFAQAGRHFHEKMESTMSWSQLCGSSLQPLREAPFWGAMVVGPTGQRTLQKS